jgi:DHA3 family macrolide efflux protein-like MFS transporter
MVNSEQVIAEPNSVPKVTFRSVLKNRHFFALWAGQSVSTFGDWMAVMALYSEVAFRMDRNPLQVSLIMISFVTPVAILGPVAGTLVDRWNTRRTMIASDLIRAVIVLLLAVSPNLYSTCFLIVMLSAVSIFFLPCLNIAIPSLVNKEELLVANSLNTQTIQLNRIICPAAAGLLLGWLGARPCYYIDSTSFIFSALMISTIAISGRRTSPKKGIGAIPAEFKEGLRFIFEHKAILFLIVSMVAAVFALGAFEALIAVYIRDLLSGGSRLFGAMISISGIGTILGAMLIGRFGQGVKRVHMIAAGIFATGIGISGIAASTAVPLTLVFNFWMGIALACVMVPAQSLMHEETPLEVMGRVSGAAHSLVTLSQLGSFLISGAIAVRLGIRNLYYLVGLALFAIGLVGYVYARTARVGDAPTPVSEG